VAHCT